MKKNTIITIIIWLLLLLLIVAGSLSPNISTPEKYHLDKIIHFGAYMLLTFIAYFSSKNRRTLITAVVILIMIGGGIEIIQTFIPERSGTIGDFAADILGVIVGGIFALKIKKRHF
jgi:VanZ family protein